MNFNLIKISVTRINLPLKINKTGPFNLAKVSKEYSYFSHLLNSIVKDSIGELPDFSGDSKIAIMSDFGGEHPGARFNTYAFLFLAYNKAVLFEQKVKQLREKHHIIVPYSEFAYKKLKSGPRSRALIEYLDLVDHFVHGAIITIAIDKRIETVFGAEREQVHPIMEDHLLEEGLGEWKGHAAEKILRVTHIISAFTALLTQENQKVFWYSDNDLINEDAKKRDFTHTQQILSRVLDMYMPHKLDILGVGKSFDEKGHLDDLLSVTDLAAGVVQDLLLQHETRKGVPGGNEKAEVMRWIATPAKYLSKITIQITRTTNGEIAYGKVNMAINKNNQ